jgi:hypothetical protein
MAGRPITLILAGALLILIGVSGILAGAGFLEMAAQRPAGVSADVLQAGIAIGAAMDAYGLAAVLGGMGILTFRRWAWLLAVAVVLIGLVLLGVAVILGGLEPVLTTGVVIWGATLALLVLPTTRRAIRR